MKRFSTADFAERLGRHFRLGALAYAVLVISLILTLLVYFYARQSVETQTGVRFEEAVLVTERSIDRRTDAYVDAIFGARAYFYASELVERDEWGDYISGLELRERYEGFQALGYVNYLEPGEVEGYLEESGEEGAPDISPDFAPGGEREAYAPIEFIGPEDLANGDLLNYDPYSEEEHRAAMDRARDSGTPRATGRVYVLTEADSGANASLALRPGFFVYLPVYQNGAPLGSVEERRDALEGFIFGSFRMDGLLGGIFEDRFRPRIDFEVYDSGDLSRDANLYDEDGVLRADDPSYSPQYSRYTSLEVGGQDWILYFSTLPNFVSGLDETLPDLARAAGIIVSLVLFVATWLLAASRERAERASLELEEANRGLEAANRELEAFSYSVSHDLRAPLRSIEGFSQILVEDYGEALDEEGVGYLGRVKGASRRMSELIDDLLQLSRVTRASMERSEVDLSLLAREAADELEQSDPDRNIEIVVRGGAKARGDERLLRVAIENLIGNAWKFTSKNEGGAKIEFGSTSKNGVPTYYVRDDGAGFEMDYAKKLFGAFQRLHTEDEFEGTGIGLATVARIVRRHGGEVWAEGEPGKGAIFYFTLGDSSSARRAISN
ncbi:MAG: CHASE domain-containing protein [Actinomycetota bacterium]|nr:CHASE domain-containing protein [Actinomycetota bacterium]